MAKIEARNKNDTSSVTSGTAGDTDEQLKTTEPVTEDFSETDETSLLTENPDAVEDVFEGEEKATVDAMTKEEQDEALENFIESASNQVSTLVPTKECKGMFVQRPLTDFTNEKYPNYSDEYLISKGLMEPKEEE